MTNTKVYFFIPNLIGYARIITLLIGIYFSLSHPYIFLANYTVSFLLDAAGEPFNILFFFIQNIKSPLSKLKDGWAARKYDQSKSLSFFLFFVFLDNNRNLKSKK